MPEVRRLELSRGGIDPDIVVNGQSTRRRVDAGQDAYQRGLAGAGRTEQSKTPAIGIHADIQRKVTARPGEVCRDPHRRSSPYDMSIRASASTAATPMSSQPVRASPSWVAR